MYNVDILMCAGASLTFVIAFLIFEKNQRMLKSQQCSDFIYAAAFAVQLQITDEIWAQVIQRWQKSEQKFPLV